MEFIKTFMFLTLLNKSISISISQNSKHRNERKKKKNVFDACALVIAYAILIVHSADRINMKIAINNSECLLYWIAATAEMVLDIINLQKKNYWLTLIYSEWLPVVQSPFDGKSGTEHSQLTSSIKASISSHSIVYYLFIYREYEWNAAECWIYPTRKYQ